jgi:hypothetical protein
MNTTGEGRTRQEKGLLSHTALLQFLVHNTVDSSLCPEYSSLCPEYSSLCPEYSSLYTDTSLFL